MICGQAAGIAGKALEGPGNQHVNQHNHAEGQDEERQLLDLQGIFARCRFRAHAVIHSVGQRWDFENGSTGRGTTVTYPKFRGFQCGCESATGKRKAQVSL